MHVDTTVEHGSSILANTGVDHGFATRVVLDEIRDIVDNTCDSDKSAAILGLVNIVVPFEHWKLVERNAPVELGALEIDLLLLLLHSALFDLVALELLEIVGEAELLPDPDAPLSWVILPPINRVPVVRWELMVEIMVALAQCEKGSDYVITGAIAVVEWLIAQVVSNTVHAECSLLHEEGTEDAAIDKAAAVIVPEETTDNAGKDEARKNDDGEIVLMLPDHYRVLVKIGDIGTTNSLRVLLHDHPAEVRVEQALADGVRVLVGIGVAVMGTMVSSPPADTALNGGSTSKSEKDSQWKCS